MAAGGGPEGSRWCERSERPPVVRALVSSTLEGSRSFAGLRRKLPFLVKPPRPLQGRSPFARTKTGGRSLRSHHRLPSVPPPAEKAERRRPRRLAGGRPRPGRGSVPRAKDVRLAMLDFGFECPRPRRDAAGPAGGTPALLGSIRPPKNVQTPVARYAGAHGSRRGTRHSGAGLACRTQRSTTLSRSR